MRLRADLVDLFYHPGACGKSLVRISCDTARRTARKASIPGRAITLIGDVGAGANPGGKKRIGKYADGGSGNIIGGKPRQA